MARKRKLQPVREITFLKDVPMRITMRLDGVVSGSARWFVERLVVIDTDVDTDPKHTRAYDETNDRTLTLTTETPNYVGCQALTDALKTLDNEDWPERRFDS
jgi:hypothetical protein